MNSLPTKLPGDYVCDFEACDKRFGSSRGLNAHQKVHQMGPSNGRIIFKMVGSQKAFPSSPLDRVSSGFPEMSSSPVEAAGNNPAPLKDLQSTLIENVTNYQPLHVIQQAAPNQASPREEGIVPHLQPRVTLQSGTSYISSSPVLMAFGVVHHTALNVLICTECRTAVLPDHLVSHTKDKHNLSPGKLMHERLQVELATLTLVQHAMDIPLPRPFGPPVEILDVVMGFRCTMGDCYHCCPKLKSVTRHQNTDHGVPSEVKQVTKASLQAVINSALTYFPVNPALELPSPPAFQKLMQDIIPNLPKPPPAQPITFRDITPFHSVMRWWEHLEQFNVKEHASRKNIIELVSAPKHTDEVLFPIVGLVHDYFGAANKFVNKVGFAIRQAIMDGDEQYWKELQSESSRTYANETIGAVSACIRFVSGSHIMYKLAMTPTRLKEAHLLLATLRKQGEGDVAGIDRDAAFIHLHLLIQTFWEETPDEGLWGELEQFWFSFLCASSVRHDGNLSDAGDFAAAVSRLKYSVRIFVVNDIPQGMNDLNAILKFIKASRERYMDPKSSQPYNLLKIRSAFASAIDMSTPRPPRLYWDDSMERCTVDDKTVVLSRLRSGIESVLDDATNLIKSLTGCSTFEPWFSTPVADVMREEKAGYSFLDDERFYDGHHPTLHRLVKEWRIGGVDNQDRFFWNAGAAVKFLGVCYELRRAFAQLQIVASTGSNRRLTELEGTSFRNSASRPRTLIMMQEDLVNISQYSKNSNTSGHDTFLPTVLPMVLRNMLVTYLVKVRPIECLISNFLYGEEAYSIYNTYLYVDAGKRMTSEKIGDASEAFFLKYLKIHLTNAQFRQFQASVCNEFIDETDLMQQVRPLARAMGHGSNVHRDRYALSHDVRDWVTTEQLRDQKVIDHRYQTLVGIHEGDVPVAKRLRKEVISHAAVSAVKALEEKLDRDLQRLKEEHAVVVQDAMERQTSTIMQALLKFSQTDSRPVQHPPTPDTNTRRLLGSTIPRRVTESPSANDSNSTSDHPMDVGFCTSNVLSLHSSSSHRITISSDAPSHGTLETLSSPPPTNKCFNPPSVDLSTPLLMSSFSFGSPGRKRYQITPVDLRLQQPLGFSDEFPPSDATPPSQIGKLSPLPPNLLFQQHSSQVHHHVSIPQPPARPSSSSSPTGTPLSLALRGLRMIYGRNAAFKSPEQEQLIHVSLGLERNFLTVIPTGGGKSSAWLVPSAVEGINSKTFVVVPFAQLLKQHLNGALELHLPAHQWTSKSRGIGNKNLIFVSAEAANTSAFLDELHDLVESGEARRLFIDEGQEGFNAYQKREFQGLLDRIAGVKIQKGVFSATVPPIWEKLLRKNCGLTHPTTAVIRARTTRPEICYHVVSLPRTHPETCTTTDA